ncbi:hypothetical protein [Sorangium sp. So ce363]|uniref:hypothetical protein n=1 Tax=Sorangium sp. So ce363 TaxID=3133304 RepID=UPI003F5EB990
MTPVVKEADRLRFGDQIAWFTQRIRVEANTPRLTELAQDPLFPWALGLPQYAESFPVP